MEDINYIKAEIEIKGKDINKEIKIINSFEQSKRGEEEVLPDDDDYKYEIKRKLKKNVK